MPVRSTAREPVTSTSTCTPRLSALDSRLEKFSSAQHCARNAQLGLLRASGEPVANWRSQVVQNENENENENGERESSERVPVPCITDT